MFIGMSSVNRGKITSTNSTHPTSQIAKQIPTQRNARNKRPIAERFSARAHFDQCCVSQLMAAFLGICLGSAQSAPSFLSMLSGRPFDAQ
jgi:hypothetical protein